MAANNDDDHHDVFPQRHISCLQFLLFWTEVREERSRNSTFQPPRKDPIILPNNNLPSANVTAVLMFMADTNILCFRHLCRCP